MPLPWARLDTNIATHDKILLLLDDSSAQRWQAAASYMFALAWCVGHDTNGVIRRAALPFVHGTPKTASLLVKYGLWHEFVDGWTIHNYADRQMTAEETQATKAQLSEQGKKGACMHWHAPHCWQEGKGCRAIPKS